MYDEAAKDDEGFWAGQAAELLDWSKDWDTICEWDLPYAKWFVGGQLNVAHNCLDRHVAAGRGDKVAIHFEGEPGDTRAITYAELLDEVQRFANALKGLGVQTGDRVNIYLPMIPEAAVAMLACARIGAAHSVVFGGFSSQALADRINDAEAKVLITADGGYRRGEVFPLKPAADEAVARHVDDRARRRGPPRRQRRRRCRTAATTGTTTSSRPPTPTVPAEPFDAEQLLFLLYTSGTTGKPKGIMHTTGGYLTQVAFTHKYVFDLHPETDVYWCTADVGWVTGHSYIVYGPLANGATIVMYEGVPEPPGQRPLLVDHREVRRDDLLHRADGDPHVHEVGQARSRPSTTCRACACIGTVGEPINPEAWMWYHEFIGGGRCPIVDTWWQTETGGDHDQPAARGDDHQARLGHVPAARASPPRSSTTPASSSPGAAAT